MGTLIIAAIVIIAFLLTVGYAFYNASSGLRCPDCNGQGYTPAGWCRVEACLRCSGTGVI